jgi:hypothetical protein
LIICDPPIGFVKVQRRNAAIASGGFICPVFENRVTDSFPGCVLDAGLKALALERPLAQAKLTAVFVFDEDPTEAFFHVGSDRRPLLRRELLRFGEKRVGYLYSRFYMGRCIVIICLPSVF